ncbi:MAG: hypothetical protein WCH39_11515 [Schlesneria sp.]
MPDDRDEADPAPRIKELRRKINEATSPPLTKRTWRQQQKRRADDQIRRLDDRVRKGREKKDWSVPQF